VLVNFDIIYSGVFHVLLDLSFVIKLNTMEPLFGSNSVDVSLRDHSSLKILGCLDFCLQPAG